jgi:hypothetical protein
MVAEAVPLGWGLEAMAAAGRKGAFKVQLVCSADE